MTCPWTYPVPGSLFGRRHAVLTGTVGRDDLRALSAEAPADGRISGLAPAHRPVTSQIAQRLSALAESHHLASPFEPTEVGFVTRHATEPRRDRRFYLGCTAWVVLAGGGTLTEHSERDRTEVLRRSRIAAGDVVLLRGWSPLGAADPRPYLRVVPDEQPLPLMRVRQNVVGSTREAAWLPLLTATEVAEARARAAAC
ncbi:MULTISPECIES: hypothetical protein [Pseudonocardia]|uniref:Uncharacterized protein n=2 Tax=Pseudonocardia TaxID=1847 RepID=A0A1Y2MXJ9_PSEAH|nr:MULTISPECIES: hypothetical protein [Pseudonocardia]OSY39699.1 hypothetical protein BG845_03297 [Pseudonocardia autotrophica]TDN72829.1 hypothetical protein C8E95_1895 [Pseudonocardia autotrophica]BBG03547.1 hypothetical protein Pdca_47560 [Pseudonocardia autotrophica]GEC28564.1 hypothetical protein PSA01_55930 [Pseudonocardia saturnea]